MFLWKVKMRTIFLIAATIGLFFTAGFAGAYTFDTDNQGWQQATVGYGSSGYEGLLANQPADWTNTYGVGSSDGSIYQTATGWEGRAYWLGTKNINATSSLGDLTGKTLETYVRSTGNWVGRANTDTVYARWTISAKDSNGTYNMWVSKADYSIDLNAASFGSGTDSDWLFENIEMVEGNFFQWPNSTNSGSFSDVLTDYTSFSLSILPTVSGSDDLSNFNGQTGTWGSSFSLLHYGATGINGNSATWGVDNFETGPVPEPSTILLFGSGLAGLAFYRKKKK